MRLLVTGAAGFVGSNFMSFASSRGLDLRPVVRRRDQCGTWRHAIIAGELTQFDEWGKALSGVEGVVHLAARVHRPLSTQCAEREAYREINTELPIRIAKEAAAKGVRHLVFLSTIGVHGRASDGRRPLVESDFIAPETPYAETKALAEEGLESLSRQTGLALTIIRPVMVYGPGARGNFRELLRAIRGRLPLPLASVRNRRAFLFVDNLSSFILHRLAARPRGIETFIVADDERVSTSQFIRLMGEALQIKPLLLPFPPALLKRLLILAGRGETAQSLLDTLDVDTRAAKQVGWQAVATLQAGLVRSLAAAAPRRS
jgi:UDP-glucose 4-epimerase